MKQPWTPDFFKGGGRDDRLATIEVYPAKNGDKRHSSQPPQLPPTAPAHFPVPRDTGARPVSGWSSGTVVPGEFRMQPSGQVPRSEAALGSDWGRIGRRLGLGLAACGVLAALGIATFSGPTTEQAASRVQRPVPPPAEPVRYRALTDVGQVIADRVLLPRPASSPASTAAPVRAAAMPAGIPAAQPASRSTGSWVGPVSTSQPEYRFQQAAADLNVRFGDGEPAVDPPIRNRVRESRPIMAPEGRSTRKPGGMRLSCPNVPLLPDP